MTDYGVRWEKKREGIWEPSSESTRVLKGVISNARQSLLGVGEGANSRAAGPQRGGWPVPWSTSIKKQTHSGRKQSWHR